VPFVNEVRVWWNDVFLPWFERNVLGRQLFDIPIERWLIALGVFLAALAAIQLVKRIVRGRASRLTDRVDADWSRGVVTLVDSLRWWFGMAIAMWVATLAFDIDEGERLPRALVIIRTAVSVLIILQATLSGAAFVSFAIGRYGARRFADDAASLTMLSALAFLAKIGVWALGLILILDNVGIEVTALVAGLGLGGAAIALASQNILSDLFASLSIVMDRPFVLGDVISVDAFVGKVEHIGLKTTRLRSLSGEQLIMSNNDLLQSRIRNLKRMTERRVVLAIGVTYETPAAQVAAIPGMLREVIEQQEQVRFDRAHFQKYGDFALIYEAVYYVTSPDYNLFMDVQQAINLRLMERFAAEEIEFAYPTQTLFLKRSVGDAEFERRSAG
jgi:small-conductance mechanosensitive channel